MSTTRDSFLLGLMAALAVGLALAAASLRAVLDGPPAWIGDRDVDHWATTLLVTAAVEVVLAGVVARTGSRRTAAGLVAGAVAAPLVAGFGLLVWLTLHQS